MKTYYCFAVSAFFLVILFSACSDTPKEGGAIGGEFFTDENQPVETEVENINSYENADKISVEEAKALFVKLSRAAYLNLYGGGFAYGGASSSGPDPITLMHAVDKTTEDIWEKFKVQVFTFDNKTYFLKDRIFVHAYNSTFQKYCIMDFNQNQKPELVFMGKCPTTYSGGLNLNIFTEDYETYKLVETSNVVNGLLTEDFAKVDEQTLKLNSNKAYLLTYDSAREKAEFVLTEVTEDKE